MTLATFPRLPTLSLPQPDACHLLTLLIVLSVLCAWQLLGHAPLPICLAEGS